MEPSFDDVLVELANAGVPELRQVLEELQMAADLNRFIRDLRKGGLLVDLKRTLQELQDNAGFDGGNA